MSEPLQTRPVKPSEQHMQERLSEAIADQSKLMDSLAQQLLLVELAIPGMYATFWKLASGDEKITLSYALGYAFTCWLLSIFCTIGSLFPQNYGNIQRNNPKSIEDFFNKAASYKRAWLLVSVLLFIAGLFYIIRDMIQ